MDLIYTNSAREDVGVLFDYEFDLAFGSDENNFECQVQASAHCMEPGAFIYIEGTEYGGIVDTITVDNEQQVVIYSGRTWHGILAGKIIEPEKGFDYYVVSGDGNAVLKQLIEYVGLTDVFQVSEEASDVQIGTYSFRYADAYTGIRKMLAEFDGKLKMEYKRDVVVLSAVYLSDFSQNEEWDDSQVEFTVEKHFRPVNHLVCLGSGDLRNRHVIHLFADENGGIQPYTTIDSPVCDEDYILDTSHQVMFGFEEVAEVYDLSTAQTAENYVKLQEQPDDWGVNYGQYFERNAEANHYNNVKGIPDTIEVLLTEQPEDWSEKYTKYYVEVDGKYKTVEGVTTEEYRELTSQPFDWQKTFSDYYTYYSDGVTEEYKKVQSSRYDVYVAQTIQPSDWKTNFSNYYIYGPEGGYIKVGSDADKCPKWVEGKYYKKTTKDSVDTYTLLEEEPDNWETRYSSYYEVRITYQGPVYVKVRAVAVKCPEWVPNLYYTKQSKTTAPSFYSGTYYELIKEVNVPEWVADTYYKKENVLLTPSFVSGKHYEKKLDHYADLVAGGLDKMKSYQECNSISIDLDLQEKFDIGDIVGATDNKTGISIWQPITKKIVSIANNTETIKYEIGGI